MKAHVTLKMRSEFTTAIKVAALSNVAIHLIITNEGHVFKTFTRMYFRPSDLNLQITIISVRLTPH